MAFEIHGENIERKVVDTLIYLNNIRYKIPAETKHKLSVSSNSAQTNESTKKVKVRNKTLLLEQQLSFGYI